MKNKLLMGFGIVVTIIVFISLSIFGWVTGTYNALVNNQVAVQTQQGQVETQLQRRFDLVPQLVGATKGILKQEQKVFGDIAKARTQYAGAKSGTPDKLEAASEYQSAIARLLVIMENYPDLRSNDTVRDLMVSLEGTENRVNVSRQRYNEIVQVYNLYIRSFPTLIIAGFLNFDEEQFFTITDENANSAPKVNLVE